MWSTDDVRERTERPPQRRETMGEGSEFAQRSRASASVGSVRVPTARAAAARTSSLGSPASANRSAAPSSQAADASAKLASALARTYGCELESDAHATRVAAADTPSRAMILPRAAIALA